MISAGQKLYEEFATIQDNLNNCLLDDWNELTTEDKNAWEALAEQSAER